MLDHGALLPARRLGIVADLEMGAADTEQAVEGQRILRREIDQVLEMK